MNEDIKITLTLSMKDCEKIMAAIDGNIWLRKEYVLNDLHKEEHFTNNMLFISSLKVTRNHFYEGYKESLKKQGIPFLVTKE